MADIVNFHHFEYIHSANSPFRWRPSPLYHSVSLCFASIMYLIFAGEVDQIGWNHVGCVCKRGTCGPHFWCDGWACGNWTYGGHGQYFWILKYWILNKENICFTRALPLTRGSSSCVVALSQYSLFVRNAMKPEFAFFLNNIFWLLW